MKNELKPCAMHCARPGAKRIGDCVPRGMVWNYTSGRESLLSDRGMPFCGSGKCCRRPDKDDDAGDPGCDRQGCVGMHCCWDTNQYSSELSRAGEVNFRHQGIGASCFIRAPYFPTRNFEHPPKEDDGPSSPPPPPSPSSKVKPSTLPYCADSTCGAALMSEGWKVLTEWGTVNRFGESRASGAEMAGWSVPSGYSAATFNTNSYDTDPQVTQWFASGAPSAAYEHDLPVGTEWVAVAFAGSSNNQYECTASIHDHTGALIYSKTRKNDGFSPLPDPDVVAVPSPPPSAAPARIRFVEKDASICWTAYVLYTLAIRAPPSPPPTPSFEGLVVISNNKDGVVPSSHQCQLVKQPIRRWENLCGLNVPNQVEPAYDLKDPEKDDSSLAGVCSQVSDTKYLQGSRAKETKAKESKDVAQKALDDATKAYDDAAKAYDDAAKAVEALECDGGVAEALECIQGIVTPAKKQAAREAMTSAQEAMTLAASKRNAAQTTRDAEQARLDDAGKASACMKSIAGADGDISSPAFAAKLGPECKDTIRERRMFDAKGDERKHTYAKYNTYLDAQLGYWKVKSGQEPLISWEIHDRFKSSAYRLALIWTDLAQNKERSKFLSTLTFKGAEPVEKEDVNTFVADDTITNWLLYDIDSSATNTLEARSGKLACKQGVNSWNITSKIGRSGNVPSTWMGPCTYPLGYPSFGKSARYEVELIIYQARNSRVFAEPVTLGNFYNAVKRDEVEGSCAFYPVSNVTYKKDIPDPMKYPPAEKPTHRPGDPTTKVGGGSSDGSEYGGPFELVTNGVRARAPDQTPARPGPTQNHALALIACAPCAACCRCSFTRPTATTSQTTTKRGATRRSRAARMAATASTHPAPC